MKRFILSIIAYVLIIAAVVCAVNFAYVKLDHTDSDHTAKFKTVPDQIEICNFGSSHTLYGIDYSEIEDKTCFNFALSSQSLSYDLILLKHYLDKIGSGATAFIAVSYFSLYDVDEVNAGDFVSKNRRYYKFLPKDSIKEYSFTEKLIAEFPSLNAGSELFNVLLGKRINVVEDFRFKTVDDIDLAQNAYAAYERHIAANRSKETGLMRVNENEVAALYEIIGLCIENNIEPVLLTTPLTAEYLDAVNANYPEFFPDFYDRINEITASAGIRYADYSHDERFINDHSLFMDADHLNAAGAKVFTKILIEECKHEVH